MKYSRRNFLKAAGSGAVALTTVGAAEAKPAPSPLAIPTPMTKETGSFNINGKPYSAAFPASHTGSGTWKTS